MSVSVERTLEVSSYDIVSPLHTTHINDPKWEEFKPASKGVEDAIANALVNLPPILTVRVCRKCWKR